LNPKKIFCLTSDPDWQGLFSEFFEETGAIFEVFPNEKEWAASPVKDWSLGLVQADLIQHTRLFTAIPLMKLGGGEKEAVNFKMRLDKGISPKDLYQALLSVFNEFQAPFSILLVDDDKDFCGEMKTYWEAQTKPPTAVVTASHGLEALQKLESLKPDVVVADLKMPVMGGGEFYKRFREKDRVTPVLVLSAITDSEEVVQLRKRGNPVCVEKTSADSMPDLLWWRALKLKVFSSRDLRLPQGKGLK
jgi:CheY-like chemotaxis protein